ncbi:MAG: Fuc2NAc and GlcNAc transferase [Arenicella sp.]
MTLAVQTALLFSLVVTLSWFAVRWLIGRLIANNIVDLPNHRTSHQGAIPRGGGLVIIASLLVALIVAAVTSGRPALFAGLAFIVFAWASLSWWDDRADLTPKFRLIVQLLICSLTVSAFGWVSQLLGIELSWFGPILSIIGLLWMANLYNFMDGLDGLAASQSIVASISLAFWFFMHQDMPMALVCVVVAASSYAFMLWNWSPAKIFMGDVGSIGLGGFFGTLFIIGSTRHGLSIVSFFGLFGVFIADSTATILMRARRGEKIWLPHRQHFYQRLANAGYAHSKIALASLILMLICSVIATLGVMYRDMLWLSLVAIILSLGVSAVLVIFLEKRAHTLTHKKE